MIKYFVPNALMKTASEIKVEHSKKGARNVLTDQELVALIERVNDTKFSALQLLALTLTPREKLALASYYPGNRFNQILEKLSLVLKHCMTVQIFDILAQGWQNYPRNKSLLWLISDFASEDNYYNILRIRPQEYINWKVNFDNPDKYYSDILKTIHSGESSLHDCFRNRRMKTDSVLFDECVGTFMASCTWDELMNEGVPEVMRVIEKAHSSQKAKNIMLNALEKAEYVGKNNTILAFSSEANHLIESPFSVFYKVFKEPKRERFPEDADRAFETYKYWHNYELLIASFNKEQDPRRVNFWKQYLARCDVRQYKTSQFLVMDFGNYVAVESEIIGTLYFYEKLYYQKEVMPILEREKKNYVKSWMKNYSYPSYTKIHNGQWETDVLLNMRIMHMV